jgi:hypothetical protein
VLAERSAALDDWITIHLNILDLDDLRGALKPDARGQTWRGDAAALQRLLEEEDMSALETSRMGRWPGLGAAALGGGAWLRHRQAPVVTGDTAAAAASAAGVALPPLTPIPSPIHTTDGRTLTNADIAGRFVVLNFWAPWCPPCVREMPDIDRFARRRPARTRW